ncbi:MAG: ABC transporter substrate-binding protein [Pseudomonadota bacterium]
MKLYLLSSILILLAVMATPCAIAEEMRTPTETVEGAINKVLKALRDKDLDQEQQWEQIGLVINANFDFRSMSQSVLANEWRSASAEEKRRFVEYFSQYLEDTYRTKIEAYTDQHVEYLSENVRRDRAVVDTQIVTSATRIPVTYRLRVHQDRWLAYDVVIEGISLVANYRNTFSAIVKSEGVEGLLANLEGRIAAYKNERESRKEETYDDSAY